MKNELVHLDEFSEILSEYNLSNELTEVLAKVKLILLSAPTAVGRNTIIKELIKTNKYYFLISDTTRQPRKNDGVLERDGDPYWFKTEEEVLNGLKRGKYFGPAIIHSQQVSGVHIDEITKTLNLNKIALTEMEVQGVEALTKIKPDIISIFVLPPSFDVWMQRLKQRGVITQVEFKRRLLSAVKEFEHALVSNYFIFIINDDFHKSVKVIERIINSNTAYIDQQESCRKLIIELTQEVKNVLSTLD